MYRVFYLKKYRPKRNTEQTQSEVKTAVLPFDPDVSFTSLAQLFANPTAVVDQINSANRSNIYYTLYETSFDEALPKSRPFVSQEVIAFDCDKIEVLHDNSFSPKYLDAFFDVTKLDRDKTVVVFSGNGLHFVAQGDEKISTSDFFKANKKLYTLVCDRLNRKLEELGLQGSFDNTILDPQRVLRLPGTWNEKEGKPRRLCTVVNGFLNAQPIDLKAMAGGETTKKKKATTKAEASSEEKRNPEPKQAAKGLQEISNKLIKRTKFDTKEVLAGCAFLKHTKTNSAEISEPEWHAAISILAKLEGGETLCHEYSKGHPQYSAASTTDKYQFAVKSDAGPRTCENIDSLWGKCKTCPNFGRKASPLLLEGEDFIGSEENGFMQVSKKGALIPDYVGLRKRFEKDHAYLVDPDSEAIFVFNGKNYAEWGYRKLVAYANSKFSPEQQESVMVEFHARVKRGKQVTHAEFNQGGYINFQNGVLEVKSGKLFEHSPDFRFLYCLPFSYDPKALCPEFDAMMKRITCEDTCLEKMLLEFTGYALCDRDYWLQKCVILEGTGSNGKSTYLDLVKALAGKDNYSVCSMADLNDERHRHMLLGKILNISEEMPSSKIASTENFKKLFGGELTYRQIYQPGGKFLNSAKLFFACNTLPNSFDPTEGFMRRVEIIPFNAKFEDGKKDHTLKKKLLKETSGIFNRMYLAWLELKQRGSLHIAESAQEEKLGYQDSIDTVGSWARENLIWEGVEEDNLPVKEMLSQFNMDAKSSGRRYEMSAQEFSSHLKRVIPKYSLRRRRLCNGGPTVIRGLSWRKAKPYVNGHKHAGFDLEASL